MNFKSMCSTVALLLALARSGSSRRLPDYTLRRREDKKTRHKTESGRQLMDDQDLRARSMAYRSCGKDGVNYGKAGGKDGATSGKDGRSYGKDGGSYGKDGRRALYYGCLDYGDPDDDPEYFAPSESPLRDDNEQGLTGDDSGPTVGPSAPTDAPDASTSPPASLPTSPITMVPVAQPVSTPVFVPVPLPTLTPVLIPPPPPVSAPGPVPSTPAPTVSRLRGESGSNSSMDVNTDYDKFIPSGSNDGEDTEDETSVRTETAGSAGSVITIPGSAANGIESEDDKVPSNDERAI